MRADTILTAAPASPGQARIPARAALLCMAAFWLAGCGFAAEPTAGPEPGARQVPVRVAEVTQSDARRELRLPGVLRPTQRAEPAFLHAGHLAERFVARGQHVAAGQRLAALQNPALGPAVAATEARVRELDEQLIQLESEHQRARELHARGLGSEELLDRSLAQRNAAREARAQALARVAEARDQLADAILRAPFDAVVGDLLVEPGDFVPAGQPVMVLSGTGGLEVELQLPEDVAQRLAVGEPVALWRVASGDRARGRIRELGVARQGRPAPAVVELEASPQWEPGSSVYVELPHAVQPGLLVPLAAIVDPGTGQTRVFRVVDGHAMATPLTTARLVGGQVEVSGALSAGDRVVVAGHHQLLDGEPVKVLP